MDKGRNRLYDSNKNIFEKEVVKMITFPQTKPNLKVREVKSSNKVINTKQKCSALEIADAIGVYGAFGRTLNDLHKQGR